MSYALLFPGQGAQFPGMAQRHYDGSPEVQDLFARAEERTRMPLRKLCFGATRDEQARTDWTQPCVLVASLACWLALRQFLSERGSKLTPNSVAGHSLGHFTALVAAGVLDIDTAFDLVHRRGRIMYEASLRHPGGMAAVLGLGLDRVTEIVARHAEGTAGLAAVNGPDQIVVSGELATLDRVMTAAERAGAERVVRLAIGIPAHSPLMAEAQAEFTAELDGLPLAAPEVPVALNTTGTLTSSAEEIRSDLLNHMVHPVRWWESIQRIRESGTRRLVDVGPGRTLSKVHRRDLPADTILANDQSQGPESLLS